MPNWVYNHLHCHGSEADLDALAEFFTMDIEIHKWNPQMGTDDLVTETVPFTYMAMRNPFAEPYNITPDEYHGTNGFVNGERVGNTEGNWYNWNSTHWGVKWDACRVDVERSDELITYHFESPWGPPLAEMFLAMSMMFPDIAFTHNYEEEQGWGGEYEFQDGQISEETEWDIPSTHADYVDRDMEYSCICAYEDDPEYMYDDCPKKIGEGVDNTLASV